MIPIVVAAKLGIPLVDCDGMGRAFPELPMVTFHLNGMSATLWQLPMKRKYWHYGND